MHTFVVLNRNKDVLSDAITVRVVLQYIYNGGPNPVYTLRTIARTLSLARQ
jgi:hypothetical protein